MKAYAYTKAGQLKKENEDRILLNGTVISSGEYSLKSEEIFAAISDGVGGNKAAAEASEFICRSLAEDNVIDIKLFIKINAELLKKSGTDFSRSNMAATLSGIILSEKPENNIKQFHIGNTRIGVMRGKYLKQITTDHTTVNMLMKAGMINEGEIQTRKNEITACMGGGSSAFFKKFVFNENCTEIKGADLIIITSDGIHDFVDCEEIESFINNCADLSETCRLIVEKAEVNGSYDDKSIVIIKPIT